MTQDISAFHFLLICKHLEKHISTQTIWSIVSRPVIKTSILNAGCNTTQCGESQVCEYLLKAQYVALKVVQG
jgi:hypothetical protein